MSGRVADFLQHLSTLAEPPTDKEKSLLLAAVRGAALQLLVDEGWVSVNGQQK